MPGDVRVITKGVKDVQRALRQIGDGSEKELKVEFTKIAETVAGDIRPKVPHRTGKAARSVKARGSQRGGAIAFGGSAAPHYPWLDFGGSVGRNRSIKRPFIQEGRYVYPTIREHREDLIERTDAVIARLARKAGFETHG